MQQIKLSESCSGLVTYSFKRAQTETNAKHAEAFSFIEATSLSSEDPEFS